MWKKQRLHILWTRPFQISGWNFLLVLLGIQHPFTRVTWAHHPVESEAAASNEAELDVIIHSLESKPDLTEKLKQFQADCIQNCFSKWAGYIMDKEILGSVFSLSLELSDKKLPYYHKEMKMRFSSKEELLLTDKLKICWKKVQ